jgi:hypothetical protein
MGHENEGDVGIDCFGKNNFVDTKAQFINLVFVPQALRLQFQLGNVSYINFLYCSCTTST